MDVLRTPEDCFTDLPDYPFEPNYVDIPDGSGGTLRMHHVDEGPTDGETVLFLHGEPSWSYLYRKMIPPITAAGHRAVAPDLVGFGKSDKPANRDDYTYQTHVDWLWAWLESVDLTDITLVCQDWGGLLGLRLVAEHPDRFARVVAANTFLPTGEGTPSDAFQAWRQFSQEIDVFPVGNIINGGCTSNLSDEVIAAYDAPFPDESYKEGARVFPMLVPISTDDPASGPNKKAWESLTAYSRPFLTAFSDGDPITAGNDRPLQDRIPGAAGQPHTTITGGGHFLQEDEGEQFAAVVADFIATAG